MAAESALFAACIIAGEGVSGIVRFSQAGPDAPVHVTGSIKGLSPGLHGFHVHQYGDLSDGCVSTGGHFNPTGAVHGAPGDEVRHHGDFGNIEASEDGVAEFEFDDPVVTLGGELTIVGRAIVIHAGEDDLGKGGHELSLKTGNAGGRVACGIIGSASK